MRAADRAAELALDFGRITISDEIVLYLFGAPGQNRFWPLWNDLALGAVGAVVLVDTRKLEDGFASVDFFERRGIPFIVAVNCFDDAYRYEPEEVREALVISPEEVDAGVERFTRAVHRVCDGAA